MSSVPKVTRHETHHNKCLLKNCVRFKSRSYWKHPYLGWESVIQRNDNKRSTLVENNRVDDTSANGHNAHTSDTAGGRQHYLERRTHQQQHRTRASKSARERCSTGNGRGGGTLGETKEGSLDTGAHAYVPTFVHTHTQERDRRVKSDRRESIIIVHARISRVSNNEMRREQLHSVSVMRERRLRTHLHMPWVSRVRALCPEKLGNLRRMK